MATSWPFQLIVLVAGCRGERGRVHGREPGSAHVGRRDGDQRRGRARRDASATAAGDRSTRWSSSTRAPVCRASSAAGSRSTRTGVGSSWVRRSSLWLQLAPHRAGRERASCGRSGRSRAGSPRSRRRPLLPGTQLLNGPGPGVGAKSTTIGPLMPACAAVDVHQLDSSTLVNFDVDAYLVGRGVDRDRRAPVAVEVAGAGHARLPRTPAGRPSSRRTWCRL